MTKTNPDDEANGPTNINVVFLNADQIKHIDRALAEVGEFGEVRLIKAKGKLRFFQKVSSEEIVSYKRKFLE